MSLWGRQVVVRAGLPGKQGVSISQLRVGFAVRHDRTKNPATATINVYNPLPETISFFEDRRTLVRLSAGYSVPRQIFQGNPILDGVRMEARGGDRILTIECKDGLRAFQDTPLDITFATETTLARLFAEVSTQLGLPLGVPVGLDPTITFPDYSYSGPAHVLLDRLAAMSESDWLIRDGALFVLDVDQPTGEASSLFSAEAGNLIGSPTRRDRGAVEVTSLLDSSMRPGKAFRVQSEGVNGDFVSEVVTFTGDTGHAGAFYTKVIGLPRVAKVVSSAELDAIAGAAFDAAFNAGAVSP